MRDPAGDLNSAAADGGRGELVDWLDAHIQWPIAAALEHANGDRIAVMRGRLALAVGGAYEVAADDGEGALWFTVPPIVQNLQVTGTQAVFAHSDPPLTLRLTVDAEPTLRNLRPSH